MVQPPIQPPVPASAKATRPSEPQGLTTLVQAVAERLSRAGQSLATAESCTGGLIAAACTEVAGSSAWFERGYVTYSNAAKTEALGVPAGLIERCGAVSEPVARAMAEGALRHSHAQWALAVTGIAGPTGGGVDKPVGTVWWAWACRTPDAANATPPTVWADTALLPGDRAAVRAATVQRALQGLLQRMPA